MTIPPAFRVFCSGFHADVLDMYDSESEIIKAAFNFLNDERRAAVKEFVFSPAVMEASVDELQELWSACDADVWLRDEGIVAFFQLIRDLI